jgi:hypothetical protein
MKTALGLGDSILLACNPILEKIFNHNDISYDYLNKDQQVIDLDKQNDINVGPTTRLIEILKELIIKQTKVDMLIIHVGLHDIKTKDSKEHLTDVVLFEQNIIEAVKLSKKIAPVIYWCNIPKIFDLNHNSVDIGFKRYNHDVLNYNQKLKHIRGTPGVHMIDTYQMMVHLSRDALIDHVHLNQEGIGRYATYIAKHVIKGEYNEK